MCECLIHRYHVAHICQCGEIIAHSQSAWDYHKNHGEMVSFNPTLHYAHGDSVETLRAKIALAAFRAECRKPRTAIELADSWERAGADWAFEISQGRATHTLGTLAEYDSAWWLVEAKIWYWKARMPLHARACQLALGA